MPHVPVVHVAPIRRVGLVPASAAGRTAGPEEGVRRAFLYGARDIILKHSGVVGFQTRGLRPEVLPAQPGLFQLVVAADQPETGVMAEAGEVVPDLRADIIQELIRRVVDMAGKHKVLPDDQAPLVAQVHELLVRIQASSPDADAVEMRPHAAVEEKGPLLPCDPCQNTVLGNVIRPHGEDLHAVDCESKFRAVLILFCADCKRPQTDAAGDRIFFEDRGTVRIFCKEPDLKLIEGMLPESCGPPQGRR